MPNGSSLVWARDRAITASNTSVIVHRHQSVGSLSRGACRTYGHTGWLCAVLATNHHKKTFHIGKRPAFHVQYAPPLHAWRCIVCVLTRDRTCLTADATIKIHYHPIADIVWCLVNTHAIVLSLSAFRIDTRARSALDPVASVSDRDNDVTEFKLGRSRSFA